MSDRKNPQKTITLTEQEEEDLKLLAEFMGDSAASIVRFAWLKWYRSEEAQSLIRRARANKKPPSGDEG